MKRLVVLMIVLVAIAVPAFAQNLLVNGDFSDGTNGWNIWKQRGSNVAFVNENGQGKFWGANFNGGIWQTFATVVGQTYVVSGWGKFAVNNTSNQGTWSEIQIGSSAPTNNNDYNKTLLAKQETNTSTLTRFEKNFADWSSTGKPVATLSFVATSTSTTLVIKHGNTTGSTLTGLFVDNVSVTAVPEPGSILAMMTGLVGFGGIVIRRRR